MNLDSMLEAMPSQPLFLIAGPCVVESKDLCMEVAETALQLCNERGLPYVFKASYRKANRSSASSFTGIGDDQALGVLAEVRSTYSVPVLTDIHNESEAIKKGQFMSPSSMKFAADKVLLEGNSRIWLTERGSQFGYHDLVVDFRSVPIMQGLGYPVVVDITHALQRPNQESGVTSGTPEFIETLGRAAVAAGSRGIFLETHPQPSMAKSDGANMLPLNKLEGLLDRLAALARLVHTWS
jgi:2-dehydro-3-deoxyphosphooctonate aldolase (KDO 8-P synthase)